VTQGWFPGLAGLARAPSRTIRGGPVAQCPCPHPYRCGGSAGLSPASQFSAPRGWGSGTLMGKL
jgi:hypothetical protein